jgi:hypothetical protein
MKLVELEPQFFRVASPGHYDHVATQAEAQGVMFLCPKCFAKNGGNVGTHKLAILFRDRGVPSYVFGQWSASGTGYADLTLSPSINLENPDHIGCEWHGFVRSGDAT